MGRKIFFDPAINSAQDRRDEKSAPLPLGHFFCGHCPFLLGLLLGTQSRRVPAPLVPSIELGGWKFLHTRQGAAMSGGGEEDQKKLPAGLYVIASPIGNLGDITLRALETLRSVDLVACEDTRTTQKLLNRYAIRQTCISYHEHNERTRSAEIAERVAAGRSVALLSDAGTPAISDPGFRAVRECRRKNLPVIPIPGPCAIPVAICASGLPSDAFLFLGFLPPKSDGRKKILTAHEKFPHTLILYESCHRIGKLLEEIPRIFGENRYIAIGQELTKLHETFFVGRGADALQFLKTSSQKGEFVVLIAPEDYTL
jgi:16S rRNA (cytidine1402-2'-O)-methyltransferase